MKKIYPPESSNMNVFGHLEELRKRLIIYLVVLVISAIVMFGCGKHLIRIVLSPLNDITQNLIFIHPTEVFVSYIKISLLAGFIISFPVLLYHAWAFIIPAAPDRAEKSSLLWMMFGLISFLSGILFSYYIALPAALNFLIQFGNGIAEAQITMEKYVSFFILFILIGGIIFEIPVTIGLLTKIGILRSSVMKKKRHYALVIMLIISAVITPTQDIINMLVFALPMILLFEIGILFSTIIERKNIKKS
ncbi:MAG: twin-arginine translocase subunit TatC [Candidatus Aureabacteria bacterium]|nr:twin-arginine translocase subunit TatC [Candidatus Auribacterota bacterium]